MLCFVLWTSCCSFLSIKIYVCTWVDLLFVNTYTCMWIHDFKNLMEHKKIWHAMTNTGAINSKHTKTYGVTKNHRLPWKFVTPCCQMACHVIIAWKIESVLIVKDNNIFNYLINDINLSNQWHEAWSEVSVTSH